MLVLLRTRALAGAESEFLVLEFRQFFEQALPSELEQEFQQLAESVPVHSAHLPHLHLPPLKERKIKKITELQV